MHDQKAIRSRKKRIDLNMGVWAMRLADLQALCRHPNAEKIARSNTGNYDPSADAYWYDCRCPDCGKFWMEDQ